MRLWKSSHLFSRGSDESGDGTYKVPYKTILQAMKRYGKEPFPEIMQDSKPDSEAAKEGRTTGTINLINSVADPKSYTS